MHLTKKRDLPDDLWLHVFQYIDTQDAFLAAQVSKEWAVLLMRRCPWLWRRMRVDDVVHVLHVMWEPRGIVTRSKRKRQHDVVYIQDLLRVKGTFLHYLTLGSRTDWVCPTLLNEHLSFIADMCTHLRKLKLYMSDAEDNMRMSTFNKLMLQCPQLHTLALPVSAAFVLMDELPLKYMSIHHVQLFGDLVYTPQSPTEPWQPWLGSSIVSLELFHVTDLNNFALLRYCTNLKHLIIRDCSSAHDHGVHIADVLEEDDWMYELMVKLETLGIIRSSQVVCMPQLLNSFLFAENMPDTPWFNLQTLWLDALVTEGSTWDVKRLFCCLDCSTYFVYKHATATECIRCAECRAKKFSRLDTLYLVN